MRRTVWIAGIAVVACGLPAHAGHVLYLDPCSPDGCVVTPGTTDARTDTTDLIKHPAALTPWRYGATSWSEVVACVRRVMAPFDVQITDVDPGAAEHLEVIVAGAPTQLGQPAGVGGVADIRCTGIGACSPFQPNALAFVFADTWNGNVIQTCASAAQQIAHTWALDHVIDPGDPMSALRATQDIPRFKDRQACGGDCVDGYSQLGLTCTGAAHTCLGTGAATQDEVQILTATLGASTVAVPDVMLVAPRDGAAPPGFSIEVACPGDAAVVDIAIDGEALAELATPPYVATASPALALGAHTITATCTSGGGTGSVGRTITVGAACTADTDCAAGGLCDGGACVAGTNVDGGLGTRCKTSADCQSQLCASQGYGDMYCVLECAPVDGSCPAGFACMGEGATAACWAADPGGCNAAGAGGAPGLILAWFFGLAVNKRRSRTIPPTR